MGLGQALFSPGTVCGSLLHLPESLRLVGKEPFPVPKLGSLHSTHYCRLWFTSLEKLKQPFPS